MLSLLPLLLLSPACSFVAAAAAAGPPNGYACQNATHPSFGMPFCNASLPFDARVDDLLRRLTQMQYSRNNLDFRRGTFRARGDVVEVFPAYEEDRVIRFELFGDELESILEVDPLRGEILEEKERVTVYPSGHYVTPQERMERAVVGIEEELEELERAGLYYSTSSSR